MGNATVAVLRNTDRRAVRIRLRAAVPGWVSKSVRAVVSVTIGRAIDRALIGLAEFHPIQEIQVGVVNSIADRVLRDRVDRALTLVKSYSPRRFERFRRDCPRVIVGPMGRSVIMAGTGSCLLEESLVRSGDDAYVASILVYQSVLLQMRRADPLLRFYHRISVRAMREQVAFLQKLPRSEHPGLESHILSLSKRIQSSR